MSILFQKNKMGYFWSFAVGNFGNTPLFNYDFPFIQEPD